MHSSRSVAMALLEWEDLSPISDDGQDGQPHAAARGAESARNSQVPTVPLAAMPPAAAVQPRLMLQTMEAFIYQGVLLF